MILSVDFQSRIDPDLAIAIQDVGAFGQRREQVALESVAVDEVQRPDGEPVISQSDAELVGVVLSGVEAVGDQFAGVPQAEQHHADADRSPRQGRPAVDPQPLPPRRTVDVVDNERHRRQREQRQVADRQRRQVELRPAQQQPERVEAT